MSNKKKRNITAVASGGIFLATLAYFWAQYVEPYRLELTEPVLDCPRLPKTLDGLRVLLLADPHTDKWGRREDMVLEMLQNDLPARPDIIVWGGDFLFSDGNTEAARKFVAAVQKLFPDIPTYGILGNAEHKLYPKQTATLVKQLRELGINILLNASDTLTLRGEPITIAGVDDPYYGHDNLEAALAETPAERFTLLLAHSPQIVYRAARAGVDVMLSGHTHGGQVRLPFYGALKTQNTLGRKMDNGLFDADRLRPLLNGRDINERFRLYVTRGVGVAPMWRFHWLRPRFFCRPEIALIQLKSS